MHPTTHDRASVLGESITAPCRATQASAIVMGSVERQECFKELPNGPKELGESLCRNGQSVQWRQTALGCTESLPRVDRANSTNLYKNHLETVVCESGISREDGKRKRVCNRHRSEGRGRQTDRCWRSLTYNFSPARSRSRGEARMQADEPNHAKGEFILGNGQPALT